DADGNRSNTWIADGRGRLVGVVDADGHRQSTSYDRYGNPVTVTSRDGATTTTFYDERGRRVRQVSPSGADVEWVHDELDRMLSVTVTSSAGEDEPVQAVTRDAYEGDSRDPAEVLDPEGGITTMVWQGGLLREVVDPEGVRVEFAYDEHGDLIASTDAEGNVARLERDGLGRITAAVTPLGNRTVYCYDGAGPLTSRQDPDGGIWRYEHTAAGRLRAVIDPTGGRTEIEHGSHGEQARTIDALGRAVSLSYDDLGLRTRVELPDGASWGFIHDAMSRLVETKDASGGRWRLGYDVNGRLVHTVDPTGVERQVERNASGLPVRAGDRLSQTTADYDALGRTVAESGPDGSTTSYRYDRCGRIVEATDAAGGVTQVERDRAGRAVHVTHPMGSTFSYEYDSCGRRSATIDTDGSRYGFGYDGDGRLVREFWPTGEQAWLRYDQAGRVVERFEPGRGVSQYGYDAAGRLVRTADAWNGRRRFRYDAAGQLVEAVNALGGLTRYDYDLAGRCVAVVDPLGGRTARSYDAMGRITAETDPLGRTTRYGYDAAGRQVRRVDATGSVLSYAYDDTGRLRDSYADGTLLCSVERDFAARTMRVREGGGVVHELGWDAGGRLVRRMRGATGLSWCYDADGRRTSFTGVHGEQTRYSYDAAGRVSAVEAPGLGRAVVERDAIGRIASVTAPGLHASWTWDGGAVVRLEVSREGVTSVTEIERDDAGRVVAEVVDGLRTAYGYDPAGQLVEARRSDGSTTSYSYDRAGRLVREVTDGRTITSRYDAAGQLLSRRRDDGTTEYRYDEAGRRVREVGPDGERRFAWDPRGFLGSITTVARDGDRLTARTQRLSVDALGELSEVDGAPVMWDTAAALPALAQVGEVAVTGCGPLTGLLPAGTSGGSPGAGEWVTPTWRPGSSGTDPWAVAPGAGSVGAGPSGLPPGVAVGGQGGLLVAGLEWMQARVYDPTSRGFLSTDPLDPVVGAGWAGNPYSFAGNDPRNAVDPWGLRPVTDAELQGYRDSNNGSLRSAVSAASDWVSEHKEYIVAGALIVGGIAVMATGVGGPIGAAMIGGALMSGGLSAGTQQYQNGSVDWGQVGVDAAIGGVAGLAGGGAGVAAARAGAKAGGQSLGRTVLTGAASGAVEGGTAGGLSYAASGQPMTAGGLARATMGGALTGGVAGGVSSGATLTKVSRTACFVAGTQVLLADGTAKAIEDIKVGDEVVAADPETGATHPKPVVDTYVHDDVETWLVETSTGRVTSTAEHPFWVDGRGWTPVRELQPGDKLVDAEGVRVEIVAVTPTGESARVHNFHVAHLHDYHVRAGDGWVLVHNTCATQSLNAGTGHATSETVDLYRAVGVREYDSVMSSGRFAPNANSLEGRQFANTMQEAIYYADTDVTKVAILRARVDRSALDGVDFSRSIDPFIFRNGVYTMQPGSQSEAFHAGLKGVDHVF
ncbi:polymorphic toxin-type HINT domain-containing protein, partial [uncultured Jatrophihabitans sp.]|uniref:polymorphic toxin-type HINT domain-containing protein n=1 Tax=uncultured Jatrophihabitans sp. TaxID=1610747 RepID=UPI0035CA2FB9